jgi:hypothetical protein
MQVDEVDPFAPDQLGHSRPNRRLRLCTLGIADHGRDCRDCY